MCTSEPERDTEPWTTASTFSSSAISGRVFFVCLNCITDVREITRIECNLREIRNKRIGHSIGEVLLIRITGEVLQGKDG